ncbi:MAG: HlyD family efflux transporter periplasmic adaptor subunit, partial [Planctomycetota bacterium]|nr:HlyD family efflux transporter periplasmic adaptor subunit [Planctomycetota bacterium]
LPTTVLVLAAFAAVLLGMAIIPMSFQVACDGQLVPDVRRDVFAPTDGLVSQIHVDDQPGLVVKANSPLLNLSDENLLDEMNQLEGRQRQLEQRIEALRKDTVENYARLTLLEEQKLQSQADEAKTELEAVRQSLKLKLKEFKLLEIQSPIEGRLVDWQITQKLYRRYVQRGQVLVSLVDPSGPWHVELSLPEKHLRHVQEQASKGHPVSVSLVLASLPGRSFNGEIEWVDRYATVDPVAGNSVQVRVKLDSENLPPEVRVAGARVSAKIACGSRSSGYVLFHDLWDTLQQRVLFWIW